MAITFDQMISLVKLPGFESFPDNVPMAVADTAVELETHLVSADQILRLALFDTDKLTLINDEFGGSDVDIETIREFTI